MQQTWMLRSQDKSWAYFVEKLDVRVHWSKDGELFDLKAAKFDVF